MEFNNNLGEYKESINRPQATPQEVEKVKQQIEYSNRLVKAHNLMKVLDLPDEQDNTIRQILLKQDDNILEKLATKSRDEIQIFIINAKESQKNDLKNIENQKKLRNDKFKDSLLNSNRTETTQVKIEETQEQSQNIYTTSKNNLEISDQNQKNDEKFNRLKSAFPQSILEKNPKIAEMLREAESSGDRQKVLDNIKDFLKKDNNLKSITDQLGGANKNNPEYLEFKNALVGVDSGFESYFNDLEKMNSGNILSTNEIVKGIEKESGGVLNIDLNSNTPMSKMSLIGSSYSFDEEIDKKALDKVTAESKDRLDEAQNSSAVLNGLYKPFDNLVTEIRKNWGKDNSKEKLQGVVNNISRSVFSEANDMYEKMGIKSDIQLKESDFAELANADSESDLRQKMENIKEKFRKITAKIQEIEAGIKNKYQIDVKELVSRKSEAEKKQLEVLDFMRSSGFDLIPKEISDKIIREIQANTLIIPGLNMGIKNIDLKSGNFGEDAIYQGTGLNHGSKTNMVKFMNKLISGDLNKPMSVEAITNGTMIADPSELNGKFLEAGIVDNLGWSQYRMMENLKKAV